MRFEDENGSISVHSDAEDDAPHARQVLTKEYPTERQQAKAKAAPKAHSDEDEQEYDASHARQVFSTERQQAKAKAAPKARKPPVAPAHDETEEVVVKKEFHVERNSKQAKAKAASKPAPPTAGPSKSRSPADLFDDTSESSHATSASDPDARFKISITGPQQTKVEFNTRGRHFVRKVLQGACKTFDVDFNRFVFSPFSCSCIQILICIRSAKLMLRVPIDGHDDMALLELGNEETMWKAGVRPDAKLIIRIDRDEDESEDED
ncbi:hypothetical protein DFH06DRAFT_8333 [Mycena polygramma]|nr:hypothetical protein DFH06DRAFT_8333 [Mycena polygramma]